MNKAQRTFVVCGLIVFAVFIHTFLCEWGGLGIKKLPSMTQFVYYSPPGLDYNEGVAWMRDRIIWSVWFGEMEKGKTAYNLELAVDEGITRTTAIVFGIFTPVILVFLAVLLQLSTARKIHSDGLFQKPAS